MTPAIAAAEFDPQFDALKSHVEFLIFDDKRSNQAKPFYSDNPSWTPGTDDIVGWITVTPCADAGDKRRHTRIWACATLSGGPA